MNYIKCFEDFSTDSIYGPEQSEILHKVYELLKKTLGVLGFKFYIEEKGYNYSKGNKNTVIWRDNEGYIDAIRLNNKFDLLNIKEIPDTFIGFMVKTLINASKYDWFEIGNIPAYELFFLNTNRSSTTDKAYICVDNVKDGFKKIIGKIANNLKKSKGILHLTKSFPAGYTRENDMGISKCIALVLSKLYINADTVINSTNPEDLMNDYMAESLDINHMSYEFIDKLKNINKGLSDKLLAKHGGGYNTSMDLGDMGF